MVLQNLEKYTKLSEVYQDWRHTQMLLRIANERLKNLNPTQVHILMENIIMHRLLGNEQPVVRDLFQGVQDDSIYAGFQAIRTAPSTEWVHEIKTIMQLPWESSQMEPTISLSQDELRVGSFIQAAVSPVKRLISVAKDLYAHEEALYYVARCALRYASIYAKTRHIGPPQIVYDHFYSWGVRNEGFASPFNARLLGKPDGRFFSLFPDTDAVFGSQGSMFLSTRDNHEGAWSLDPPFIPETMTKTVRLIKEWRTNKQCPAILLIVPTSFTPSYTPAETVQLYASTHYYTGLEGVLRPLPVDVSIHRYGSLPGFDAQKVIQGYLPVP